MGSHLKAVEVAIQSLFRQSRAERGTRSIEYGED